MSKLLIVVFVRMFIAVVWSDWAVEIVITTYSS